MVQACESLQDKANVGLDRSPSIPCENSPKIAAEAAVERVLTSLQTTTTNHLAESARSGFWIDDDGVARPKRKIRRDVRRERPPLGSSFADHGDMSLSSGAEMEKDSQMQVDSATTWTATRSLEVATQTECAAYMTIDDALRYRLLSAL